MVKITYTRMFRDTVEGSYVWIENGTHSKQFVSRDHGINAICNWNKQTEWSYVLLSIDPSVPSKAKTQVMPNGEII